MKYLQHDVAWATAHVILDVVAPCLREEEQRDALDLFYEAVKAGIEKYHELLRREDRRLLRPSAN